MKLHEDITASKRDYVKTTERKQEDTPAPVLTKHLAPIPTLKNVIEEELKVETLILTAFNSILPSVEDDHVTFSKNL